MSITSMGINWITGSRIFPLYLQKNMPDCTVNGNIAQQNHVKYAELYSHHTLPSARELKRAQRNVGTNYWLSYSVGRERVHRGFYRIYSIKEAYDK